MRDVDRLTPTLVDSLRRRFARHVSMQPGCWEWTGATMQHGGGIISVNGHREYAQRVSYLLAHVHANIRNKVIYHHAPRNGVAVCVNPSHLRSGKPGRQRYQPGKRKK